MVLAGALFFYACAQSGEGVHDPFDPTTVPQFELRELMEVGRDNDGSVPLLNRVTAAIFVGSQEIAVASNEGEILVFRVDGEFLRRLGRSGEGPGEFRFVQDIVSLDGNRILAWDPALDRVTVFERDGRQSIDVSAARLSEPQLVRMDVATVQAPALVQVTGEDLP